MTEFISDELEVRLNRGPILLTRGAPVSDLLKYFASYSEMAPSSLRLSGVLSRVLLSSPSPEVSSLAALMPGGARILPHPSDKAQEIIRRLACLKVA